MAAYEVNVEEVEPMSRTYQYRKVMKPMLERKRRARINKCLDELKDLMVGALQSEGESITKLEKADVLELTVKHLKKLKQHHALAIPAQNHASEKFRAGFGHCANEVRRFVDAVPGVDMHISARLFNHLGQWMAQMDKPSSVPPSQQGTVSPITAISTANPVPLNIPRVYTPPASPEAKVNTYKAPQPPQQPLSLIVKPQSTSPPAVPVHHHYQVNSIASPIHRQYNNPIPTSAVSSSVVPAQIGSIPNSRQTAPTVIVSTTSPKCPNSTPSPTLKEPINYSPKSSPAPTPAATATGIKVEVPPLSPVWRPW